MTDSSKNKIRLGMLLEPSRFILDKFTAATTPHLIRGLVKRFDCRLITSQSDYNKYYDEVEAFFSFEPQFAAPKINWKRGLIGSSKPKLSYVMCSDAHREKWREKYMLKNGITFLLGLYYEPFQRHFTKIPNEQLIHFPWAIPDEWITNEELVCHKQSKVCCFGGANHEAYNIRNWCREFDFIDSHVNSGVENKVMDEKQYVEWLKGFDAMIAAGSDNPIYGMATPKYFEIAASGSLLFAQHTEDLESLGFIDNKNSIIFDKSNFEEKAKRYLSSPDEYLEIRKQGRELIKERHTLTKRLNFLEEHMRAHL